MLEHLKLAVLDQLGEVRQVLHLDLALAGVEILQQQSEGPAGDLPVAEVDGVPGPPALLKQTSQERTPGAQQELVGSHSFSVDVESDVFASLILEESPEELCVGLPPLGDGGQHLVVQQQLPDVISQGSVDTSLPVKGVTVTDSSSQQEILDLVMDLDERRGSMKNCQVLPGPGGHRDRRSTVVWSPTYLSH